MTTLTRHEPAVRMELITPPAAEPLALDTTTGLKYHLRIDVTDFDAELLELITVAREQLEKETARALITQTWDMILDGWPSGMPILVRRPPLQSVTSIKYIDEGGVEQTWAASKYQVSASDPQWPGRILPAYGESAPTIRSQMDAVTIRIVAGYGDEAADVPRRLIHALKLACGGSRDFPAAITRFRRGEGIETVIGPLAYQRLIRPFVVRF